MPPYSFPQLGKNRGQGRGSKILCELGAGTVLRLVNSGRAVPACRPACAANDHGARAVFMSPSASADSLETETKPGYICRDG